MATRNRTPLFRKYRDSLKSARAPLSLSASTSSGGRGPVIELSSLVNQNRNYAPLSTEDPVRVHSLLVYRQHGWMYQKK
ncbi:hypothetical protein ACLB2K_060834 [Fragaria x ananassa]